MDLPIAPSERRNPAIPRRPLATARPGFDYLRSAFLAAWASGGTAGAGELATAYVQSATGTHEATSDYVAVARWVERLHARSPRRHLLAC